MTNQYDIWKSSYSVGNHLISKIKIIDNFLPNYDQQFYIDNFDFLNIQTNYRDEEGYIGTDIFSTNDEYKRIAENIVSQSNLLLKSYNTEVKQVLTKVLLISDLQSPFQKHRHVDDSHYLEKGFTLSYHWMGDENAGGTAFFTDFHEETPLIQIPFKPNRLVIFPSCIPHEGYANPHKKYNSKRIIFALFTELT